MHRQASALIDQLHAVKHTVVLTGAGVSAESGVPTFRDAQTGLWARYDPAQLATPEAFAADPARVAQWYDHRRQLALSCKPNAAHDALARIERWLVQRGQRFTLLTQNVDRLHQRAGSQNVREMHGTLLRWRCVNCHHESLEQEPEPFDVHPPPCAQCRGPRRPCVVWFGEMLPREPLAAADRALRECDLFLSVGTSATIHPVAGYIDQAIHQPGIFTGEINPQSTGASEAVDCFIQDTAAHALDALAHACIGT